MIIPGARAFQMGLLRNVTSETLQIQPCGIDLTLNRVLRVKTAGAVDFDNSQRLAALAEELQFPTTSLSKSSGQGQDADPLLHLSKGAYRVEFNECVNMPLDVMGQVLTRSSVWRTLAWVEAGVMDAGYSGAIGAAFVVANDEGIWVSKKARLAQIVFHKLTEPTTGYNGQYQDRTWV